MNVNTISVQTQSSPTFNGLRVLAPAKDVIRKNLPEFYTGNKNVEEIFSKLENTQIDFLKFLGIKKTKSLEPLSNLDIILHNVYIDPSNNSKFYLYSIPTMGKGLYSVNTKKSILESPVAICREILKNIHAAEVSFKTR